MVVWSTSAVGTRGDWRVRLADLKMDADARKRYKVDIALQNAAFLAGRMLAHWEMEKVSGEQIRARVEAGEPPLTPRTRAVIRGEASEAEIQEHGLRRGCELRDCERRIAQELRDAQELQQMFQAGEMLR